MRDCGIGSRSKTLALISLITLTVSGCAPLLSSSGIDRSGRSFFDCNRNSTTAPATTAPLFTGGGLSEGCSSTPIGTVAPTAVRVPDQAEYREFPGSELPWDNTELILTPAQTVAPVGSDVVLLAGVRGQDEYLRTNERVEWTVSPSGVGSLVDYDKGSWVDYFVGDFTRPRKANYAQAVTSTSRDYLRLNRESPVLGDDIMVKRGQTWVAVSSPVEGTSQVTAYAPSVYGWATRKQTATIHWIDAKFRFPSPTVTPAGGQQQLTTTVARQTNNQPLVGWCVRYKVCGGSPAGFVPDGAETIDVATNGAGQATATLFQKQPGAAMNRIQIAVIRPASANGTQPRVIVGRGSTVATWSSPELQVRKTGPSAVGIGHEFVYRITAINPGDLPTDNVTVTDEIPPGLEFVAAAPAAQPLGSKLTWDIGRLGPRENRVIEIRIRSRGTGAITSCAEATAAGGLHARSCVTTVVGHPQLKIQVLGPPTAKVGDEVRFEMVVTNQGQVTATNLLIKDTFDQGLKHELATSPIEKDLGDLAPGASERIEINFRVTQPGQLCHQIEVTGDLGIHATSQGCVEVSGFAPIESSAPAAAVPQPERPQPFAAPAKIKVTCQANRPSESPSGPVGEKIQSCAVGEKVVFTMIVDNVGETTLHNLKLIDTFDSAFSASQASKGHKADREKKQITWTIPTLTPDEEPISFQIECEAKESSPRACNRVRISCDEGATDQAESCIEITQAAASPSNETGTGWPSGGFQPPSDRPEIPSYTPPGAQQPGMPQTGTQQPGGLPTGPGAIPSPQTTEEGNGLELTVDPRTNPAKVGRTLTFEINIRNRNMTADQDAVLEVILPPEVTAYKPGIVGPKPSIEGQIVRFDQIDQIQANELIRCFVEVNVDREGQGRFVFKLTSRSLPKGKTVEKTVLLTP